MGNSLLQKKSGFVVLSASTDRPRKDYVTLVDQNGLIQVIPRRRSRRLSLVPLKLLALFVVLLTVFKALALMNVGLNDYQDEIAVLENGTVFEKLGAIALQVDPVTMALYGYGSDLLK